MVFAILIIYNHMKLNNYVLLESYEFLDFI